jgi:hypothetical protein
MLYGNLKKSNINPFFTTQKLSRLEPFRLIDSIYLMIEKVNIGHADLSFKSQSSSGLYWEHNRYYTDPWDSALITKEGLFII